MRGNIEIGCISLLDQTHYNRALSDIVIRKSLAETIASQYSHFDKRRSLKPIGAAYLSTDLATKIELRCLRSRC